MIGNKKRYFIDPNPNYLCAISNFYTNNPKDLDLHEKKCLTCSSYNTEIHMKNHQRWKLMDERKEKIEDERKRTRFQRYDILDEIVLQVRLIFFSFYSRLKEGNRVLDILLSLRLFGDDKSATPITNFVSGKFASLRSLQILKWELQYYIFLNKLLELKGNELLQLTHIYHVFMIKYILKTMVIRFIEYGETIEIFWRVMDILLSWLQSFRIKKLEKINFFSRYDPQRFFCSNQYTDGKTLSVFSTWNLCLFNPLGLDCDEYENVIRVFNTTVLNVRYAWYDRLIDPSEDILFFNSKTRRFNFRWKHYSMLFFSS
jgi:hypothetical protein